MADRDDRMMSGDATDRPNGGTCPACKRDYERALAFTDADGVIRGEISGDFCLTPAYLFAHSPITISAPDDEFPTRTIGAMGNRKEVPVDPTAVSGVWSSDDEDGFETPD